MCPLLANTRTWTGQGAAKMAMIVGCIVLDQFVANISKGENNDSAHEIAKGSSFVCVLF